MGGRCRDWRGGASGAIPRMCTKSSDRSDFASVVTDGSAFQIRRKRFFGNLPADIEAGGVQERASIACL